MTLNVDNRNQEFVFRYVSYTRIPSILHSSAEARANGLEHYSIDFGNQGTKEIGGVQVSFTFPPRIYINFERDTLCLGPLYKENGSPQIVDPIMARAIIMDNLSGRRLTNRIGLYVNYANENNWNLQESLQMLLGSTNIVEVIVWGLDIDDEHHPSFALARPGKKVCVDLEFLSNSFWKGIRSRLSGRVERGDGT